jgi:hypothetical protein
MGNAKHPPHPLTVDGCHIPMLEPGCRSFWPPLRFFKRRSGTLHHNAQGHYHYSTACIQVNSLYLSWQGYCKVQTSEVCSPSRHLASREFLPRIGNSLRGQNLGGLASRDNAIAVPVLAGLLQSRCRGIPAITWVIRTVSVRCKKFAQATACRECPYRVPLTRWLWWAHSCFVPSGRVARLRSAAYSLAPSSLAPSRLAPARQAPYRKAPSRLAPRRSASSR